MVQQSLNKNKDIRVIYCLTATPKEPRGGNSPKSVPHLPRVRQSFARGLLPACAIKPGLLCTGHPGVRTPATAPRLAGLLG
jgi:hypothetical protein